MIKENKLAYVPSLYALQEIKQCCGSMGRFIQKNILASGDPGFESPFMDKKGGDFSRISEIFKTFKAYRLPYGGLEK